MVLKSIMWNSWIVNRGGINKLSQERGRSYYCSELSDISSNLGIKLRAISLGLRNTNI